MPELFLVFRNECIQTTSFGPRIMLKLVSHHLVDARKGCKRGNLGAINAGVWGTETFPSFFARNASKPLIWVLESC